MRLGMSLLDAARMDASICFRLGDHRDSGRFPYEYRLLQDRIYHAHQEKRWEEQG